MTSNAGHDAKKKRRSFQLLEHPFTVETVVVADMDVVQHHGAEAAGRFLLTVMNMVRRAAHLHRLQTDCGASSFSGSKMEDTLS